MPRHFSFWLLVGFVAAIGFLFFHIIKPFIVAIFIAIVLAVLFTPVHRWVADRLAGHDRIAAGITTALVMLLILLPIGTTLLMAGTQIMQVSENVAAWFNGQSTDGIEITIDKIERTKFGATVSELYADLPNGQQEQVRQTVAKVGDGVTADLYAKTRGLLTDVFTFALSLSIMTLGLYYFLADRDLFTREIHRLLPFHDEEEERLTEKFQSVCQGVVLGTIVAGVVQATLSGIAFGVLGVPNVWVLIVLTMFCSFIPFVGAAAVWAPVSLWLFAEGRYAAGIGLLTYGAAVVSTSDNLVRAYVIGNQAKLHPLVALISVLGALKLMGLWGIFVGPMVAAFLYALLNITKERARYAQHRQTEPRQTARSQTEQIGVIVDGKLD
ncbi:AI-2E family transporter [Roseimaritima ulvae]|uniref:Putative inner membrane protein n=1 Tax=Roseimaritima ulvae TaxID=980254 RepID=A0A5B9QYP2_9BACT|nr:AI-2E family transporter [Roseimaritima ulvae]QEG43162.1 putative inner membrane protein [Roseimaritima ulvae]